MVKANLQQRMNELHQAIGEVPDEIELSAFLEEFKPEPNCKKSNCYGRGFSLIMYQPVFLSTGKPAPLIGDLDKTDKKRKITFCPCVWKKYLRSNKHYRLYIEQDNGAKDFLFL
jgi:hypothetical protein